MDKIQEKEFWNIIKLFDKLHILEHVVLMGSFAEFLYTDIFGIDFQPNIMTRDVDFFYKNIKIPDEKIDFVSDMEKLGYVRDIDRLTGVSRFYKEDVLEIEFLTRLLGDGKDNTYEIRYLGIKSEGLRDINIISDYTRTIEKNGYKINIPEPAVYVIQKLLINRKRKPEYKRGKDISSILEILYHIKINKNQYDKLKDIYGILTKKQKNEIETVCKENSISLF